MKGLKYPVIPFTIFFGAGIFTGFYILWLWLIALPLFCGSFLLMVSAFYYSRKHLIQKSHFTFACAFFAFSAGIFTSYQYYSNDNSLYSYLSREIGTPVIKGVVSERIKPNAYNEKYIFEANRIGSYSINDKLLLTQAKDSLFKPLHVGDVLYIYALPKPITRAMNPYQFNYADYMAKQRIYSQIKLKENYILSGQEHNTDYYIDRLRNKMTASFNLHHFKPETKNLINALLFGQRQDMDKETTNDYTNAGVIHVLAISGLHFTLLFAIFSRLLSPLRRIRKSGPVIEFASIITLIWLFAFITGLSASVVRAAVMITFLLTGEILNRRVSTLNSLAVSALFLLLFKPAFLFDAGFQLSYMAVLGIILFQPFYSKWKSKHTAVNWVTDLVMVSIAAQIAVLPLSLYYFNQFPLMFLVANIAVIPISNAVIILALIVLVLNFTLPALAIYPGYVLEWLIIIMNGFIKWVASFEAMIIKNIPFTLTMNILLYTAIGFGVVYLYKRSFKTASAALIALLAFQLSYMIAAYNIKHKNEFVVFHNFGNTIIADKKEGRITLSTTDSLALENYSVMAYAKGNFNVPVKTQPLQNVNFINGKKIFVLDASGTYSKNISPDILILSQSPKVNLERVIAEIHPKQVIADATNYKSYVARWQQTCLQKNIPFHATAEKGYYME